MTSDGRAGADQGLSLFGGWRDSPVAFRNGEQISWPQFAGHVAALAAQLPAGPCMINLCEDRYAFLVAFAAAQQRGHTVLLPSSRAEQIVVEVERANAGSYRCDDAMLATTSAGPCEPGQQRVAQDHVCMIGFTSGSTGEPRRFPKLWRSVHASTMHNAGAIRAALGIDARAPLALVATVPPQHMYGMELSILLPLLGGVGTHADRPLFPADIARALAQIPAPRVLVSTPVHLRAMVESSQAFPEVALIVSATAPLEAELAIAVERKLGGQLLEMFGSTETCVFANRFPARETAWRLYEGVQLKSEDDGTLVSAPWFAAPTRLQDVVDMQGTDRFVVRGRNTDMIEVAGKRASLADLTRRLLEIPGVTDAVVFQPESQGASGVRRVAALVVCPGLNAGQIVDRLRDSVDPAFLPRPLRVVEQLPRNELGKLPREALLAALRIRASGKDLHGERAEHPD